MAILFLWYTVNSRCNEASRPRFYFIISDLVITRVHCTFKYNKCFEFLELKINSANYHKFSSICQTAGYSIFNKVHIIV